MQKSNINGTTRVGCVELGMLMDQVMWTAMWIVLSGMIRYVEMTRFRYGGAYVRGDVSFIGIGSVNRLWENGLWSLGGMKRTTLLYKMKKLGVEDNPYFFAPAPTEETSKAAGRG